MRRILIANRGEIAVRIARACRDAGLTSVAVYAEPDLDALHVQVSDEAYALGGATAADSYLDIGRVLEAAKKAGADAVHPGYGFLAENACFARAVQDSGLTWIGPPPDAINALGDKVKARALAQRVGAPLVAGTDGPVSGAAEVEAFAREHGLPIAIKAAYGGGGRGLKVARTMDEVPELYESAVREAVAAFGRGDCFVERYLDKPRHVETQCVADAHGNVVVASTRDCSLQRRHQKLVEEAPAPFLTAEQDALLREASKALLRAAGYVGVGTCEFLVAQDGTISFLEVNTRLQVEHPVTEEVAGLDLVREMFRVAAGEPLGYDDPPARGHSIEFRINAEDAGRGFLPAAGTLARWEPPSGPGVRLDSGYVAGQTVPQVFDSLIAKLVVTGATRRQAVERARRALAEFGIAGLPTVLPFHRAVLDDPAFVPADDDAPFTVHTRWIETEFDNRIPPWEPDAAADPAEADAGERERMTVEVDGRRVELVFPPGFGAPAPGAVPLNGGVVAPARRRPGKGRGARTSGDALVSPMQGTIVKIVAADGAAVEAGDTVLVLEAMKMEQPLAAHKAGTVTALSAEVGQTVTSGAVLCTIEG
ncbi:biotin carboxylase N-terminal domain-containing protein [Actinomadura sp. NEAU-AAG7]|uniref:ATP-binding protein n=1 Tax=Actinomadura sp. NEAU-AAG7 TaxID=2839640 RepID=UPI001BE48E60|nr:biotin carboxylase N-terminal domain-containing protein [Actinomadura sp. NEAU-AAG7]MBT2207984.1 ATP-grasp domain-containing protein [Actinomadura sp. NEAU-AAG7]